MKKQDNTNKVSMHDMLEAHSAGILNNEGNAVLNDALDRWFDAIERAKPFGWRLVDTPSQKETATEKIGRKIPTQYKNPTKMVDIIFPNYDV